MTVSVETDRALHAEFIQGILQRPTGDGFESIVCFHAATGKDLRVYPVIRNGRLYRRFNERLSSRDMADGISGLDI